MDGLADGQSDIETGFKQFLYRLWPVTLPIQGRHVEAAVSFFSV